MEKIPQRSILIIVPTYNEAVNIHPLLEQITSTVSEVHLLFVDDASVDGTVDKIKEWQFKFPERIHLIQRSGKLGLGTAYIAGFKWALERDYRAVLEMDADLSHDPKYLPEMFDGLNHYDAVLGSRYVPGGGTQNWSLLRRAISRFGSLYAKMILGLSLNDLTGGFNAWNRRILETICLDEISSEGYSFQIELKYRAHLAGFTFKEIPIVFVDRLRGKSKMSHRIVVEAMFRVWLFLLLRRKAGRRGAI